MPGRLEVRPSVQDLQSSSGKRTLRFSLPTLRWNSFTTQSYTGSYRDTGTIVETAPTDRPALAARWGVNWPCAAETHEATCKTAFKGDVSEPRVQLVGSGVRDYSSAPCPSGWTNVMSSGLCQAPPGEMSIPRLNGIVHAPLHQVTLEQLSALVLDTSIFSPTRRSKVSRRGNLRRQNNSHTTSSDLEHSCNLKWPCLGEQPSLPTALQIRMLTMSF